MSPFPDKAKNPVADGSAFSLIEVLVAMAVLALMVVFLSQLLQSASDGLLGGKARVNSFTKARSMLDLLSRDVQAGVFRDDLAAFADGSPSSTFSNIAFYTRRSGVPVGGGTDLRSVSLVQYTLGTNGVLKRGDYPVSWSGPADGISFGVTNAFPKLTEVTDRDTVPGVVGFRVLFLQTNGILTNSYDPSNRPVSLAIGMAFVDDNALKKLTPTQLDKLQSDLAGQVTGTNSPKADWDAYLQGGGMSWAAYPKDLGRGLKIFERYVLLPRS